SAQAVPMSFKSLRIVPLATPVIRLVARTEFPSTSELTTATFFSKGRLFMPTIMLERSSNVKHYFHSSPFKQGHGLPGIMPSPAEFSMVPRTHKKGGKPVTIGIGVICDAYRTVILAADARGSYL